MFNFFDKFSLKIIVVGALLFLFLVVNQDISQKITPKESEGVALFQVAGIRDLSIDGWFFLIREKFRKNFFSKKWVTQSEDKIEGTPLSDAQSTVISPGGRTYLPKEEDIPRNLETSTQEEIKEILLPTPQSSNRESAKEELLEKENVVRFVSPPVKMIPPTVLNEKVRNATVNIFCLSKSGGFFKPLSGSGVIIDSRGVILTNAHVAEYFLLENYKIPGFMNCVIRTGSPAKVSYKAVPLFISKTWVESNKEAIITEHALSNGENDYALLYITESVQKGSSLPESFSSFTPAVSTGKIYRGAPVLIASYPAGFLGAIEIHKDLWTISTISRVVELFTFDDAPNLNTDIFEVEGTLSAQEGSSGGGVADFEDGELLGIVTTRTEGETTSERGLRILSISHIKKSFEKESGVSIETFLQGNLAEKADAFASTTAPLLKEILYSVLDR